MKRIILVAMCLISVQLMTAQTAKPSNELAKVVKNELDILKKADLNLTEVQVSRITMVLNSQDQLLLKTQEALNGNKSVLDQRLKELKSNKINNILGAMTDQQVEKFKALKLEDKF